MSIFLANRRPNCKRCRKRPSVTADGKLCAACLRYLLDRENGEESRKGRRLKLTWEGDDIGILPGEK